MLFNSYIFIFGFLPITLLGFFGLSKLRLTKLATAWLVIASLFFYAYWKIVYLPLLTLSIVCNYTVGHLINLMPLASRASKIMLAVGIGFNLSLLSYYKYTIFLVDSLDKIFPLNWVPPTILLPLGISFFTFTQIGYLVDTYKKETKNYNFLNYSLFVTLFPHLIAGLILDHKQIIPQFNRLKYLVFSHKNMAMGLSMFILGLFKKTVIADSLSAWVATEFDSANTVSFLDAWAGALSYTYQLYFDFSGYSDMAIGLGAMLNIRLPINFNSPYKSLSIIEFWRRWHVTLSNFLRDYLYIPLGGNRRGKIRQFNNLLITMLLGGLWHGAGWNFVVWGGIHGVLLVINHSWRKLNIPLPKILAWTITFLAVVGSWVFFRAHTLPDAVNILKAMTGVGGVVLPNQYENILHWLTHLGVKFEAVVGLDSMPSLIKVSNSSASATSVPVVLSMLTLCVTRFPNTQEIIQWLKPTWLSVTLLSILATLSLLSLNHVSEFLYFQF